MRRKSALEADRSAIRAMCNILGVDVDTSLAAYQEVIDRGILQGRDALVMQAAAVLVAVRRTGASVTIDEIADLTGKRKWLLGKAARLIAGGGLPPAGFDAFLERGIKSIGLPDGVRDAAAAAAPEVKTDMSPSMRAATVLYMAACRSGVKVSRKDVARAVGVNQLSIKQYVRRGGVLTPKAVAE